MVVMLLLFLLSSLATGRDSEPFSTRAAAVFTGRFVDFDCLLSGEELLFRMAFSVARG